MGGGKRMKITFPFPCFARYKQEIGLLPAASGSCQWLSGFEYYNSKLPVFVVLLRLHSVAVYHK
jgi:hypothetical protein